MGHVPYVRQATNSRATMMFCLYVFIKRKKGSSHGSYVPTSAVLEIGSLSNSHNKHTSLLLHSVKRVEP